MVSKSKSQTQKFAAKIAKKILLKPRKKAAVIALEGELGSGKTAFTQGFIKALGSKERIASPTFVIYRKYKIFSDQQPTTNDKRQIENKFKNVFHFDLYRIKRAKELFGLGFKKIINDPANIVLIEWPEIVKKFLPENTIWINFEHGKKENERIIKVS